MAEYDDYRLANDDEVNKMNSEYTEKNAEKGRKAARAGLPVYLTDEAHRAAESCFSAAQGCVYLLDYATTPEERKLLKYAADSMNGLCSALGGGRKISSKEPFGTHGVKRTLEKTFVLCNDAAIRLCRIADSSGGDAFLCSAARTALCATQSALAVYLMQI